MFYIVAVVETYPMAYVVASLARAKDIERTERDVPKPPQVEIYGPFEDIRMH